MDVQQEHFLTKAREMGDKLDEMAGEYDTKVLAIVMLTRAANLLRILQNLDIMGAEEINRTIMEAIKDVHTELPADQLPQIKTIGQPLRLC